jgi:Flp pilus assembly protein TadG
MKFTHTTSVGTPHRKASARNRRAVSAVEMAVVAPLVFLLVFGLVEFARMVMLQQALVNAARQGSRTAILANVSNSSDAEAAVRTFLSDSISSSSDTSKVRVTITPSTLAGMASGTSVTTRVEVTFSDVSWAPPSFLGGTVLVGESTMKKE